MTTDLRAEAEFLQREEREAWIAYQVAIAPVEITGEEHAPEEIEAASERLNRVRCALDQVQHEVACAARHGAQPPRTCSPRRTRARGRERRHGRSRTARASSSSDDGGGDSSDSEGDPEPIAGAV